MKPKTTRSTMRLVFMLALVVVLLAIPIVVHADNIVNSLGSGFAVLTLNQGGSNGTVTLVVVPQNGDGKQGCNLTGSKTLVASISSDNTSVATVTPSTFTFTSCGDIATLTVHPVATGTDAHISVSQVSNNTGGTFDFTNAGFTVHVSPPPNTPPTVSVTGVTAGAMYEFGSVPAAGCLVSDTEDGLTNSTTAATLTLSTITGPLSSYGLGMQTATCSYTDSGGLTNSAQADYSINDTTAPVIASHADVTAEATSAAGAAVSYTSPATSDAVAGAGTATCLPASGSIFALGNTTVTCNATDEAGNAATPTTFLVHVVDTTAPVIAPHTDVIAEATSATGAIVAYTSPATSDAVDGAGVASCLPTSGTQFGLANTTVTCNAQDNAGNIATPTTFVVHVVDTTPPTIDSHANVGPIEATGPTGAIVNYTSPATHDAVDGNGTADCSPSSGSTFALGATTVTCAAVDVAGNHATGTTFTITVQDTTPPEFLCGSADGAWHASDVSISCTARDLVGLADSGDASFSLSTNVPSGSETSNASTGTHQVCDTSSNCVSAGPISGNMVDKKAPSVSCGGADGLWHGSDVSIGCTASDDGSGLENAGDASFSLTTNVSGGAEDANASTASRVVLDAVGNPATAGPISGNMVDKKPPTFSCVSGPSSWSASDVSVNCTASDGGSGLDNNSPATFTLSTTVANGTETANAQTNSQSLSDGVGNSDTAGPLTFKVDKKDPTFSCGAAPSGWSATDVNIACTASDGGSGLATPTNFSLSTSVPNGTETSNASTDTAPVTDNVGHSVTAGPISGIKVDKKVPTSITFVGSIADGATYYFGFVPAAPTCTATDGGSGLASCTVTGYSNAIGAHTLTATAQDNVGNQSTETSNYRVNAWTLSGFYQPVDMNGVYNVVKNGSTVPLKFEIFAGPSELSDTADVKSLTFAQTTCDANAITDDIETTATGGTSLRYDTTAGQFVYNWKTPSTAGKCYRVTMTTLDGSSLVAYFKLK